MCVYIETHTGPGRVAPFRICFTFSEIRLRDHLVAQEVGWEGVPRKRELTHKRLLTV